MGWAHQRRASRRRRIGSDAGGASSWWWRRDTWGEQEAAVARTVLGHGGGAVHEERRRRKRCAGGGGAVHRGRRRRHGAGRRKLSFSHRTKPTDLNVDSAVYGPGFCASATPQLDELLKEASKQVQNPDNWTQSLYDLWMMASNSSPLIGRLGDGASDYSAFVQHIGIPSVDISIGSGYAVYHSLYDDFIWMEKFGDPLFRRHVAAASMWGLVALRLSDDEILPFNYSSYAADLENGVMNTYEKLLEVHISLSPLHKSIKEFRRAILKVDSELKALQTWKVWPPWRNNPLKVRDLNDRLTMTERAFTEREGLFGRPWYKHLIYAASLHDDYGAQIYPGIDDAIQTAQRANTSESWQSVQHEIHRVARVIKQAALVLSGGLT